MTSGNEPFDEEDLLSETYRELGVEKVPEHLNQSVLRMASGGAKPSDSRNSLLAAWMKPMAWAATIGLSLAIVLEFSELPTAPVRSDSVPSAEAFREEVLKKAPEIDAAINNEEVVDETLETRAAVREKFEKRSQTAAAPGRQRVSDEDLGRSSGAVDDESVSGEAKVKVDALAAPAAPRQAPLAVKTDIPAATERSVILPGDSQPMASFSLSLEHSDIDNVCNAAARRSKESWLTCIDELRSTGSEEAADREYEAFILQYPVE